MSQHEYFHHSKAVTDLNAIALRALGTLVTGTPQSTEKTQTDIDIQTTLLRAVGDEDWGCFDRAIAETITTGASYEDIANIHVPAVARILGQAWIDGEADFSTVSIGCARLQGYLRQKGLDWCDTASLSSTHIATVLLVAPKFEQHTLGVTLLAGQLRAQGVDVILAYHATDEKIERIVKKHTCDAIMITCSRSETLALLRSEVLKLKSNSACAPIIVGGNVLDQIPDTLIRTGADFTARSCKDALEILTSEKLVRKADPVGGKG